MLIYQFPVQFPVWSAWSSGSSAVSELGLRSTSNAHLFLSTFLLAVYKTVGTYNIRLRYSISLSPSILRKTESTIFPQQPFRAQRLGGLLTRVQSKFGFGFFLAKSCSCISEGTLKGFFGSMYTVRKHSCALEMQ